MPVDAINFTNPSSLYSFALTGGVNLTFNGGGILGNSSVSTFNVTGDVLHFDNSSTAGRASINNIWIGAAGSITSFAASSTAGSAQILNNGSFGETRFLISSSAGASSILNEHGGSTTFNQTSTAGSATIRVNEDPNINFGANVAFFDNSSAANATINIYAGNAYFNTHSTAASATILNVGGLVSFRDQSTADHAFISNNNLFIGGSLNNFGTITFGGSGAPTSAGSSTIQNNGGYILFEDGSSAASANITNDAGHLNFTDNSTAGSSTITNLNGGVIHFHGPNPTAGQARVIMDASSSFEVFDIFQTSMTVGSIEGFGGVSLGSKQLLIGTNNLSTEFGGTFFGAGGALAKVGAGTLILTGANTYTGATTVNGGKLVVDGSIVSATTVNAGGTLAGIGTVGTTAIAGGTLAPGNTTSPYAPLTVNGPLSFTAASTYLVQVSGTNASRTNVLGAAALGNATVSAIFSGTLQKQYTILNATSGLGGSAFNPTVVSNMSSVSATLSYDTNNVFLNIGVSFTSTSGSLTVNQQNVANTLTNVFNSSGSLPVVFGGLTPAGLTIASGELGTGVIQSAINADGQFLNLMLDPTIVGRSGGFAKPGSVSQFAESDEAAAYASMRPATPPEREAYAMATKAPMLAAAANRWSVWAAGYGGSEQVGGNAVVGSQDLSARIWGVAAGADFRVSPDTLIGFALGGGGLNYSLANAMGSGSADLFQAGVYGRHNFGPAYVAGALVYGWHDVTTNRTVALAGIDQLQGCFKADTFSARFEGGYRFATPLVGITPYAAVQVTRFNLPNYTETSLAGGGLFALNYAAQTTTDTRSELGFRTDKSYAVQNGVLTLRGRAAWAHDYNPNRAVTALFTALPGAAAFAVNGARPDADSALVSGSAEMKWLSGFSIAATFDGEFSGNVATYSGKGVVRYFW
ncbi:autotransporter domain-containing protein [Bradyrhizobium guangdongense]|uniref:autotransporter family protein n=1 Tax=Bradyrhizobium guangdongense TaxID=1325090 RepID=UPI0024C02B8A|nr:autotransporter domain-containing protein [Bradyrhizobium guangdongense]